MNRSLMIPAVCCFFAFAGLWTTLGGATGGETVAPRAISDTARVRGDREGTRLARASGATVPQANGIPPLSVAEANELLTKLTGQYVQPWRQSESSPHRLYSRAGPRFHVPTISATVEPLLVSTDQSDSFLLATITAKRGKQVQQMPCVVDRLSRRTRIFAEGKWLTEDEWLKKAPLP